MSVPVSKLGVAVPSVLRREWHALAYFCAYRVVVAAMATALGLWGVVPRPAVVVDPSLFVTVSATYLVLSFAALLAATTRTPGFSTQVTIQLFVDIFVLTVLMHASGGITSGFGMLLAVAIAGGGILSRGRVAILFAAIASLAVLAEQFYAGYRFLWITPNYPHAGILGAVLFAAAFLANSSARRLRVSEALAARREIDLAELGRLNAQIVRRLHAGILAVDSAGHVRLANSAACRLLGVSELPVRERVESRAPALSRVLVRWRGSPDQRQVLFDPGNGYPMVQASFADLDGDPGGAIMLLEDYAQIGQRVQQLKLASLGRLAGSIAHEIRNPLSAVVHANGLLQESERASEGDRRLMQIVDNNARRMNDIVESVLRLSRRTPADPRSVDVAAWLDEFCGELRADAALQPDQVGVKVDPADLTIRADTTQIRQVLHNLCENALQHASDGQLARIQLDAGLAPGSLRPFIDVRDNGPGIPDEALDKLFEPFFTTRASGSGLGLYVARELCEANQATINHRPVSGGCCFRISFPDPNNQDTLPT